VINNYRLAIWLLLQALSIGELYDDIETWGTEKRRQTPIRSEYRSLFDRLMKHNFL